MPEGDGNPDYLATATGGVDLAPGESVTIRYRLTLSALNPKKTLVAVLFAVQLPQGVQLAVTNAPSRFIGG